MTQAALLAIGRPTFDIDLGRCTTAAAMSLLSTAGVHIDTDVEMSTTPTDTAQQVDAVIGSKAEVVVVLQATFTDASAVISLAERSALPIVIWSFPEPRTGGRLRLNSFCGANLAAFSLRARKHRCAFVHADPHTESSRQRVLDAIERAGREPTAPIARPAHLERSVDENVERRAVTVTERLEHRRVGVIGDPPVGFEPCVGSATEIESTIGVHVKRLELDDLFDTATRACPVDVQRAARRFDHAIAIDPQLSAESLEPSERLYCGLTKLAAEHGLDAIATRCWPECMTVFGGAACTAQALSTEDGVPAVCEADMLGAVTALMLREVSSGDPFIADLVDLDPLDDTSVLWHCGLASPRLANPGHERQGTVHPNRGVPLINQFALRPGRVTIARLSRSESGLRLVIAGGTMLDRRRPFDGTSGTLRWDLSGRDVVDTVFDLGIDHHLGIVYGEHRDVLVALARRWGIPVVRLGHPT